MNPAKSRRTTKQRELIYSLVMNRPTHPSAEEVHALAKAALPSISLGTVYRNLKVLVEEGRLLEVHLGDDKSRFDGMTADHEHFICTNCGAIRDVPKSLAPIDSATVGALLGGVEISSYTLSFYGLCEDCRQRSNP